MRFSSRSKITITLLLLMALVASLGLLVSTKVATHAASTSASLSLYPASGPPTSTTDVFGASFSIGETVGVTFDTKSVGTVTANGGNISLKIHIPSSALPGNHTVTATGQSSGLSAQATFLVQTNWPMFGFDPQQTHYNPYENILTTANVSKLKLDWKYQGQNPFLMGSPAVSNGLAYIDTNPLSALDQHTGTVVWQVTQNSYGSSSPATADGIVFVGTNSGSSSSITAMNAQTGAVRWTYPLNGFTSTPIESDGTLYVGSIRGNRGIVLALREQNGTLKWSFETKYTVSAVSSSARTIYVGAGKLYALDAVIGLLKWSFSEGSKIDTAATVVNNVVYVSSNANKVYALDTQTGALLWKASFSKGQYAPISSLAVANGVVYVGSSDSHLYALDAQTGTTKWSYLTGGGVLSTPAVANGVVYVGSEDSKLYALDASSGTLLWSNTLGGTVESSPAVANGVVYVGADDGNMYAFHLPGTNP